MYSRSIQEQQRWSRFNRNRNVVSIHMLRFIHSPPLRRRGAGLPSYWSVDPLSQFTSSFLPPIVNSVIPKSSVQLNSAIPQKLSHSKLWQCYNGRNSTSWSQHGNDLFTRFVPHSISVVNLTSRPRVSVTTDLVVVKTNRVRHLLLWTTWKLHWKMHGSHICFVQFWKIIGDQI